MKRHLAVLCGREALLVAIGVTLILTGAVASLAATPPGLVNYQGVLRDASDEPRTGSFDMVFSFHDAATAGSEILVDAHTGGGGNAVTVSGGLFNVQLGSGTVTDGSGTGSYTSLDQVFRDHNAVWLEIKVGSETLSPRIRVLSAAYALNASNLQGKAASSFVDTSSTGQSKAGHLTVDGGMDITVTSGIALNAQGTQTGGAFGSSGSFAYVADTGFIRTGIRAQGNDAGGFFKDSDSSGVAYTAYGDFGIDARGNAAGGVFGDNAGSVAYAGHSAGYGVIASGTVAGGSFSSVGSGSATLAIGNTGINASGAPAGHFQSNSGVGSIDLASGDFGALGYGRYPGAGGYFADPSFSGKSWVGFGDYGIYGIGAYTGGYFTRSYHNVQVFLGSSDYWGSPTAVYGYSNESGASPSFFIDEEYGSWAEAGDDGAKIFGVGAVSFVQNHPTDPTKTIVYSAPEGDEVGVYTRGTARLVNGQARVALGETFAMVANPDIGLTATVTPADEPISLAVVEKSTRELLVRGPDGSSAEFDYMIWGLRIGFENRAVVRAKRQEAYIPSHRVEEDEYAKSPELRRYSALSRFTSMRQTLTGRAEPLDLTASKALENAIHVFDPATDARGAHRSRPEPFVAVESVASSARAPTPGVADLRTAGESTNAAQPGGSAESGTIAARPILSNAPGSSLDVAKLPANSSLMTVIEVVEAGDVLANDAAHPGELRRAARAADPGVIGIVAGTLGVQWSAQAPIALPGTIVLCKVDASYAAIAANDLLIASPTPGYAMRAGDAPVHGTVIGKALEPLVVGSDVIRVLVMSR